MKRSKGHILTIFSAMSVMACATADMRTPARLSDAGAENIAALKAALAAALGRATIEFGPGDLSQDGVVAVLPPHPTALEDRSLVRPALFDLWLEGDQCLAIAREGGAGIVLSGVSCRPA